jgi:hypothetical protein
MTDLAMQSCCCRPDAAGDRVCRACGNSGIPVPGVTVESLVAPARRSRLASLEGFAACRTLDCPVAYFASERDEYIDKADLTVRIGVKENEDPAPLCYCFGWTKRMVDDEVARAGTSSAVLDIAERMRATGCACERTNPSGRCCLPDVEAYAALARGRAAVRDAFISSTPDGHQTRRPRS